MRHTTADMIQMTGWKVILIGNRNWGRYRDVLRLAEPTQLLSSCSRNAANETANPLKISLAKHDTSQQGSMWTLLRLSHIRKGKFRS